jgi:hypothetical protein
MVFWLAWKRERLRPEQCWPGIAISLALLRDVGLACTGFVVWRVALARLQELLLQEARVIRSIN